MTVSKLEIQHFVSADLDVGGELRVLLLASGFEEWQDDHALGIRLAHQDTRGHWYFVREIEGGFTLLLHLRTLHHDLHPALPNRLHVDARTYSVTPDNRVWMVRRNSMHHLGTKESASGALMRMLSEAMEYCHDLRNK